MIVTILANPIDYFLEASKLFDFVINIISTIDAVSTWTSESGSAGDVGIQVPTCLCTCYAMSGADPRMVLLAYPFAK